MRNLKFEIWSTRKFSIKQLKFMTKWFWHLKSSNGQIIAQGETDGYYNKKDLEDTIDNIKAKAFTANTHYL